LAGGRQLYSGAQPLQPGLVTRSNYLRTRSGDPGPGQLGLTSIQIGDTEEAARNFIEVIRDGTARKVIGNVLTGLIGMAWIRAVEGSHAESAALLGLVFYHPAGQDENIRGDTVPVLELLRQTLSEDEIQYGMEDGKLLNFDEVVTELVNSRS
jgi:hypothetical protein